MRRHLPSRLLTPLTFHLNLGARIAAEPIRLPPIQDLIDEHRSKKAEKAA
jgi:hypothetical protein